MMGKRDRKPSESQGQMALLTDKELVVYRRLVELQRRLGYPVAESLVRRLLEDERLGLRKKEDSDV
jgi:hypothetical protein